MELLFVFPCSVCTPPLTKLCAHHVYQTCRPAHAQRPLRSETAERRQEELEDLPLLLLRNLLERHQVPNRMSFSGEESPKTRSERALRARDEL